MAGVYSDPKHRFVNPYNFIPLAKECNRTQPGEDEKLLTGYIDCELKTLTPAIISDTSDVEEDAIGHKTYRNTVFLNGRPAIPASEIRGMIRSKFEVLTASCMSSAEPELEFFSRYKGSNMNYAAVLDLDTGKLYRCDKYLFEDSERGYFIKPGSRSNKGLYATGDMVSVEIIKKPQGKRTVKRALVSKDAPLKGYVRIGEEFNRKSPVHVFVPTEKEIHAENEADFKKMFNEIREKYRTNFELYQKEEKAHIAESYTNMQPLWYECIKFTDADGTKKEYVYFSLGQNGQTKNRRKFKDVVRKGFLPCDDKENLCEGCRLFGTVNDKNGLAVHGKLRFEDALLDNSCIKKDSDEYYVQKKPLILEELSTPRAENARFYMTIRAGKKNQIVDKSEWMYSTDFKSKFGQSDESTVEIKDNEIEIRGRKEYWHFKPALKNAAEKTQRNLSVRPLKEGLKYNFRVYFEGISRDELEHLRMTLSLDNKSDYAHKIGGGKPLGFGSVKIKTIGVSLRNISFEDGKVTYRLEKYAEPEYKKLLDAFDAESLKRSSRAIVHMYDFNFLQKHIDEGEFIVDYPRESANGKIFEWFAENEKKKNGEKKVLPFADKEYDKIVQASSTAKEPYIKAVAKNKASGNSNDKGYIDLGNGFIQYKNGLKVRKPKEKK